MTNTSDMTVAFKYNNNHLRETSNNIALRKVLADEEKRILLDQTMLVVVYKILELR